MNKIIDTIPKPITSTIGELRERAKNATAFLGKVGNDNEDRLWLITSKGIVNAIFPNVVYEAKDRRVEVTRFVDIEIKIL